MNICEWKPTTVFPDAYMVSNKGDVFSIRTGKLLKPTTDKDGYLYYVLCVNGKRVTKKAHRLVAEAFIENVESKPAIDHINGIRTDNNVTNLRWVTNKENTHNPITMERLLSASVARLPLMYAEAVKNNFNRKRVEVVWANGKREEFESVKKASIATRISYSKLSEILNGKRNQNSRFVAAFISEGE